MPIWVKPVKYFRVNNKKATDLMFNERVIDIYGCASTNPGKTL
jgi:hypothetical protein